LAAKISELRARDVINLADGRRIGRAADFELDLEEGRLVSLIVPGPLRFLGLLGRERDYVVPWERIVRIGVDVILVDLKEG